MKYLGSGTLMNFDQISSILQTKSGIDWVEITSEHLLGSHTNGFRPLITKDIEALISRFPTSLHGLELSIGSVDPLDMSYLRSLKELAAIVQPEIMSDHLVWTGAAGFHAHELLPFPYTKEALTHVCERISRVQDFLGRQFLLENPPSALRFKHAEFSDAEFMNEMARKTGCGLLIDINNLFVSSENNEFSSHNFLNDLKPQFVGQFHLAGFHVVPKTGFLLDTHSAPVAEDVWKLYEYAIQRMGPRTTNVEWLGQVAFKDLYEHCKKARSILDSRTGRSNAA